MFLKKFDTLENLNQIEQFLPPREVYVNKIKGRE